MRRLKKFLIGTLTSILLAGASCLESRAAEWEILRTDTSGSKLVVKETETEISTLPSRIIVHLAQNAKVEVFTILGRIVNSETLAPGSYEFHVEAHGIYILKIGDFTCKVAL